MVWYRMGGWFGPFPESALLVLLTTSISKCPAKTLNHAIWRRTRDKCFVSQIQKTIIVDFLFYRCPPISWLWLLHSPERPTTQRDYCSNDFYTIPIALYLSRYRKLGRRSNMKSSLPSTIKSELIAMEPVN